MKSSHLFVRLVACFAFPFAAEATPYYVNNCGSDTCNGRYAACWSQGVSDCAKKTIQAGMNLGQTAMDVVSVAPIAPPGTYSGLGNRDLQFPQTGGVARAFTVRCQTPGYPQNCVIDCQGSSGAANNHRGFWFNNDHATNNSVVEGFTIKNGYVDSGPEPYGGAIYIDHSAPTIQGCLIEQNKANAGGGIAMNGCCPGEVYEPLIESCTIRNNQALYAFGLGQFLGGGGGALNAGVHMDALINYSTITGNTAAYRGGGLSWALGSEPRVEGCVIEGNTAAKGGGGVYVTSVKETSDTTFHGYILRSRIGPNNSATTERGGGVWIDDLWGSNTTVARIYIENCTIVGNHADASFGGGVSLFSSASSVGFELSRNAE